MYVGLVFFAFGQESWLGVWGLAPKNLALYKILYKREFCSDELAVRLV